MKIREKVLIAIGLTWVAFILITYTGSHYFLLDRFLKIEHDNADRDLDRIDAAFNEISNSLYAFTVDWSHWNDLYKYVQGKNPQFIANNLVMNVYTNYSINLLTYWNKAGKLLFGVSIDTQAKKLTPFPAGLKKYLFPGSLLLNHTQLNHDVRGNILLGNKIMIVAASGISNSNKNKPSLGAMVVGRTLTPEIIKQIETITQTKLQLFTSSEIAENPSLSQNLEKTISNNGHFNKAIDEKNLEGFTLIKDIYGKPIGYFRLIKPRLIYLGGLSSIHYYLVVFTLAGILISFLMMALLRKFIVSRLEKLDTQVAEIRANHDITERVEVSGNDELSSVAAEFNAMLQTIQLSQQRLEHHVEQRTQELQQTNVKLQHEILERKIVEKELIVHKEHLVQLAHYDNLTTLPNRIFFNEIFNKALTHAARNKNSLALLFIDLDRFKNINDAFGHEMGDLVLKELSSRFSAALREGDVLARLGGDEFILLLNNISQAKFASTIAEKLIRCCMTAVKINMNEFYLTASIGICIFPNDGSSLEDLQKNADIAMYKAKQSGGGVFQYFTKDMNMEVHENIKLEAGLRRAIKNNEFILYFQPKLNLKEGVICGVEALIRWIDPNLGLINPDQFIPLAEETGLIIQIGEWALREACRINKQWQDEGYEPLNISVNISPKQFKLQDISQLVTKVLAESGMAAKYLELEITETAIMDNVDETIKRLKDIKEMGVSISIDDFGTGYSSISHLKKFPVNIIKIDRSFIKGIPTDSHDVAITGAVIAMAHNLGFDVVAEGVETPEQMKYLDEQECDVIQGYYISRPLPENKIVLQFTKINKDVMA